MKRAEAIALGLKKYFTGKQCRHGHTAPRYTDSGSCQDCLAAARTGKVGKLPVVPQVLPAEAIDQAAAQDWRRHAWPVPIRLFDRDLAAFAELLRWTCVARWPTLVPETFDQMPPGANRCSGGPGNRLGNAVYKFRAHPEDHPTLLAASREMFNATNGPVQMPDWHTLLHKVVEPEDNNWPEGDPR